MKTILAPVDFSAASDAVVREAAVLAQAVNGRVVVLSVIQPPVIASEYLPIIENLAEITAAGEKAVAMKLAKVEQGLQAEGIAAVVIQATGGPVSQIVKHALALPADYVVMGSHGHSAVYDLLMGGTTHGVLKRVKCPVMILPPKAPKGAKARK